MSINFFLDIIKLQRKVKSSGSSDDVFSMNGHTNVSTPLYQLLVDFFLELFVRSNGKASMHFMGRV